MPCKLGITSMSLGRCYAGHSFTTKLDAAYKYGYKGIELFFEDLVDVAETMFGNPNQPSTGPLLATHVAAAHHIRRLCQARDIEIICLQPFSFYDGLLNRREHNERLEELKTWFTLARALETDIIQIPANFLPADLVTEDLDVIVSDLREVADLGLRLNPPIRFAYESLCWSTRVDTWERCWEVVQRVDRPNFGICLDTFNIAGRIYADPAVASGMTDNAEKAVQESIARLIAQVDVKKVFYVQVVDAERLSEPLVPGHPFYNAEQPARMSWSRNCRLFYGEQNRGGYLPIKEIAWAFFHGLGFEGWVSLELFSRSMNDSRPEVPEELAWRGARSWDKLKADFKLKDEQEPRRVENRVFASL